LEGSREERVLPLGFLVVIAAVAAAEAALRERGSLIAFGGVLFCIIKALTGFIYTLISRALGHPVSPPFVEGIFPLGARWFDRSCEARVWVFEN